MGDQELSIKQEITTATTTQFDFICCEGLKQENTSIKEEHIVSRSCETHIKLEVPEVNVIVSSPENANLKLDDELVIKDEIVAPFNITVNSYRNEQLFRCDMCQFVTKRRTCLKNHAKTHIRKMSLIKEEPLECNECEFKATKLHLSQHLSTHVAKNFYSCGECKYKSKNRLRFHKHIKAHVENMPFECHECGYRTATKKYLKRHIMTHTEDKLFRCTECEYKTTMRHHLQRHKMVHTGEKPFRCSLCDYRTTMKHHLKTHMLSHSGEKPFKCSHCEYSAIQNSALRRHLMVHTGEKPYECKECDYKAKQRAHVVKHMMTHAEKKL